MFKQAVAAYEEAEKVMLTGLSDKELNAVVELMGKMSANLSAAK